MVVKRSAPVGLFDQLFLLVRHHAGDVHAPTLQGLD